MGDTKKIRFGYDAPVIKREQLTDGSGVYKIVYEGIPTVTIHCVSQAAAENIVKVLEFGMISLEVEDD